MIEVGGRSDVLVQWFSSRYVHEHPKVFKKVIAGPGEAIVFLENGKVEKIVTEDMCKTDLGLIGRFIDWLKGTDKQMIVADLNPKSMQIPFSGYSKDRTKISGNVNLTVRVDANNLLRLTNLLRRDAVSDSKWLNTEFARDIKEITQEDILRYMSYDTSLIVDSTILTQTMSSDIRDNMDEFNSKMRNAIDSMGVSWASNGFAVDYAKADISENAYEDSMRYIDALAKIQMKQDADFADAQHNLGLESDLNIAVIKNAVRVDMATIAGEYEKNNYIISQENQNQLSQLDHEYSVVEKEMRNQLELAKGQLEIDRINGISIEETARRQTDLETYDMMEKTKVEEYRKNQDVERTLKLMNAQRDSDIERAFEDGKKQGKALAEKAEYERGVNDGYRQGYDAAIDKTGGFTERIGNVFASGFQGRDVREQTRPDQNYPPQTAGQVRCPNCGGFNTPGYRFCNSCGQPSQLQCPKCGGMVTPGSKFCNSCGAQIN